MAHISFSSSSKNSSCSLTNIDNLPDGLLREILILMPFRSIAKSKCVCKRWLRVLSSPSFSTEFVSRQHSLFSTYLTFISSHQLMLGFFPKDSILKFNTLRAPLSLDTIMKGSLCGSSNGLFLLCSNRYTTGRGYFVYDPLTKQCTHLPSFSDGDRGQQLYAVGFLSHGHYPTEGEEEPRRSFWVVIVRTFIKKRYRFEVVDFSSQTGKWRRSYSRCVDGFAFAPHWMLSFAFGEYLYFMGSTNIFMFDPNFLFSSTIDYPEDADAMNIMSFGYLGCSGDTLRIADITNNNLRVWEQRYPLTWYLVHQTNLTQHLPTNFCSNYFKRVAGFHPYDANIVYLYSYVDGIFVANLRTNKFVPIPGYDKADISPFQVELSPIPYAESHCSTSD
ncbi:hypothetical protein ACSQ67_021844 [Phaseolus vulgaris]